MKKKMIGVLLSACLVLALSSCGGGGSGTATQAPSAAAAAETSPAETPASGETVAVSMKETASAASAAGETDPVIIPETAAETEAETEAAEPEPEGEEFPPAAEADPLTEAVREAIRVEEEEHFDMTDIDAMIPSFLPVFEDLSDPENIIEAGHTTVRNYALEDSSFVEKSGGNSFMVFHLKKDGDGYKVTSVEAAMTDGESAALAEKYGIAKEKRSLQGTELPALALKDLADYADEGWIEADTMEASDGTVHVLPTAANRTADLADILWSTVYGAELLKDKEGMVTAADLDATAAFIAANYTAFTHPEYLTGNTTEAEGGDELVRVSAETLGSFEESMLGVSASVWETAAGSFRKDGDDILLNSGDWGTQVPYTAIHETFFDEAGNAVLTGVFGYSSTVKGASPEDSKDYEVRLELAADPESPSGYRFTSIDCKEET